MKIIHCSDIHLDSRMEANLSAEQAAERRREILKTFEKMVVYAQENGVSAIIIAGDLFDTDIIASATKNYLKDVIEAHPDIDFLYLCGNHDENNFAKKLSELPQNLKTFGGEWKRYSYGTVDIYGAELNAQNGAQLHNTFSADKDRINIVALHGQTGANGDAQIISIPAFKNKNIDYMALGHIHQHTLEKLDGRGVYCYSGCLEGRGFDETGEKGFVLLEIADKIKITFVPFAQRTLREVRADISGAVRFKQIAGMVNQALSGIPRKDLVKVILEGEILPQTEKSVNNLLREFDGRFYFIKFDDETKLKIDEEQYINDISLKGEFIRLVRSSALEPKEQDSVISYGLKALAGEDLE